MTITDVNSFDYYWFKKIKLQKKHVGNPGTTSQRRYKDLVCAFDIETTRLPDTDQAVMYHWQFAFGRDRVVTGRTWDELLSFMRMIADLLYSDEYVCVYIHNASYEFQFLKGVYNFQEWEVFALEDRKILKFTMMNHFEFRCSYLHSNMSLDEFTSRLGTSERKLHDFDYDKVRYPWTKLTKEEREYCIHDVTSLVEAIEIELEKDYDTLYSIPQTITGYIRRDVRAAMRLTSHYELKDELPSYHVYQLLREAFRGGNCHANRMYVNRLIEDVHSVDMSSAYPYVICTQKYPVGRFIEAGPMSLERVLDLINNKRKAVLMRINLWDVDLIDSGFGNPYISIASCTKIRKGESGLYDNGRVIRCEALSMTVTDLDFAIILSEYKFSEIEITDVCFARYGSLPRPLINTIQYIYKEKTQLKNVEGTEAEYYRVKTKLDSIFGLMAQNPVKAPYYYNGIKNVKAEYYEDEMLDKYNRKAFLPYQWGIWTTAHVRYILEKAIRMSGDRFVYCDTDSIFTYGKIDFSDLNKQIRDSDLEEGLFADDSFGKRHWMGEFEEKKTADLFKTLGSKKYVCQYGHKLEITIAGVNKEAGSDELAAAGGIDKFQAGFEFKKAAGMEARYNDITDPETVTVDGHELEITSNCVIQPSTFTISMGKEYMHFLDVDLGDEVYENIFG